MPTFLACIVSPKYAGIWGQGGGLDTQWMGTFSVTNVGLDSEQTLLGVFRPDWDEQERREDISKRLRRLNLGS